MSKQQLQQIDKRLVEVINLIGECERPLLYADPKEKRRLNAYLEEARIEQAKLEGLRERVLAGEDVGAELLTDEEKKFGELKGMLQNFLLELLRNQTWRTCPKPLPPPEKFAGRFGELAELKTKLKAGELVAITALNGLGGIGKTTLARQLAHELYYESGPAKVFRAVLWLVVARQPEEGRLLETLARQAEPDFTRRENEDTFQLAGRVRSLLQETISEKCETCQTNRVLMVLDDVWEDGIAIANRLKEVRPENCTVLVTTRFESVAARLGVNPRHKQALARLLPAAGAELLAEYLPDVPRLSLEELSEALGGYTLALKLAATRLLLEPAPLAELPTHLQQYKAGLPAGTGFDRLELDQGDTKDENLTTTLYYSYAALTDTEKSQFRALGVLSYDQRFDLPLLAALWDISEDEAKTAARRLWQQGLLETAKGGFGEGIFGMGVFGDALYGQGWYQLHPILHSYALALLKVTSEKYAGVQYRYQHHITELAAQFDKLPPEEWNQLTDYLPHVHKVGYELVQQIGEKDAIEDTLRLALRFASNITRYLFVRQEIRQPDWLEMGLAASRSVQDQGNEALFLNELASFYLDIGDKGKALEYYEQALPLRRMVGDQDGEATTLNNIGLVYYGMEDLTKALEYYEQALPILREAGNRNAEAATLNNIGLVYNGQKEQNKALEYFEQALSILRIIGDQHGEAATLNNIGGIYYSLDEKDKAMGYFEQALPLHRAVGDGNGEAYTLWWMSSHYWNEGEREKGLALLKQVETLFQAVQSPNAKVIADRIIQWRAELGLPEEGSA